MPSIEKNNKETVYYAELVYGLISNLKKPGVITKEDIEKYIEEITKNNNFKPFEILFNNEKLIKEFGDSLDIKNIKNINVKEISNYKEIFKNKIIDMFNKINNINIITEKLYKAVPYELSFEKNKSKEIGKDEFREIIEEVTKMNKEKIDALISIISDSKELKEIYNIIEGGIEEVENINKFKKKLEILIELKIAINQINKIMNGPEGI